MIPEMCVFNLSGHLSPKALSFQRGKIEKIGKKEKVGKIGKIAIPTKEG